MILIPVLGDQCSHGLSSLRDVPKNRAVVLMMEVAEETSYVRHHKVKIVLVLSAMRHFAVELRADGWTVDYVELDQHDNTGSFTGEIERAIKRYQAERIRVVEAGEWRVQQVIESWHKAFDLPVDVLVDDRFVFPVREFQAWAQQRRELVMEPFYREMRCKTGLLMNGNEPIGGVWNLDKQNRQPPKKGVNYSRPMCFKPDEITCDVLSLVQDRFADHFGSLDHFQLPVTAGEAKQALFHFIATSLHNFGAWQDAMVKGERFLFHSWLSPALNCGLLTALDVCKAAADAYESGEVPLNSAEGFIRQILGWREYIRGIYWLEMPALADSNELRHDRPLPDFYWTGDTDLLCLREAVTTTHDLAYAHHIQRLMVLGNFALLAGVSPRAISDWFLVVYADAYEWVELPNVVGMSQFADGGRLGSKPYVSAGAYISRMSDYCADCRYDVKKKVGEDACPFNALYWNFLARHEHVLRSNSRMGPVYRNWDRMADDQKRAYRASASMFLDSLIPATDGWAKDV